MKFLSLLLILTATDAFGTQGVIPVCTQAGISYLSTNQYQGKDKGAKQQEMAKEFSDSQVDSFNKLIEMNFLGSQEVPMIIKGGLRQAAFFSKLAFSLREYYQKEALNTSAVLACFEYKNKIEAKSLTQKELERYPLLAKDSTALDRLHEHCPSVRENFSRVIAQYAAEIRQHLAIGWAMELYRPDLDPRFSVIFTSYLRNPIKGFPDQEILTCSERADEYCKSRADITLALYQKNGLDSLSESDRKRTLRTLEQLNTKGEAAELFNIVAREAAQFQANGACKDFSACFPLVQRSHQRSYYQLFARFPFLPYYTKRISTDNTETVKVVREVFRNANQFIQEHLTEDTLFALPAALYFSKEILKREPQYCGLAETWLKHSNKSAEDNTILMNRLRAAEGALCIAPAAAAATGVGVAAAPALAGACLLAIGADSTWNYFVESEASRIQWLALLSSLNVVPVFDPYAFKEQMDQPTQTILDAAINLVGIGGVKGKFLVGVVNIISSLNTEESLVELCEDNILFTRQSCQSIRARQASNDKIDLILLTLRSNTPHGVAYNGDRPLSQDRPHLEALLREYESYKQYLGNSQDVDTLFKLVLAGRFPLLSAEMGILVDPRLFLAIAETGKYQIKQGLYQTNRKFLPEVLFAKIVFLNYVESHLDELSSKILKKNFPKFAASSKNTVLGVTLKRYESIFQDARIFGLAKKYLATKNEPQKIALEASIRKLSNDISFCYQRQILGLYKDGEAQISCDYSLISK